MHFCIIEYLPLLKHKEAGCLTDIRWWRVEFCSSCWDSSRYTDVQHLTADDPLLVRTDRSRLVFVWLLIRLPSSSHVSRLP